jgi:hypothetical protein
MKRKTYKNQSQHQHLGPNGIRCGAAHPLIAKHTKASTISAHNRSVGSRYQQKPTATV